MTVVEIDAARPAATGRSVAPGLRPPRAFDAACELVVAHLSAVLPMGLWAVTRVVEDEQVMLVTDDTGYGFVTPGLVVDYRASMCQTMVAGATPRIAPDTADVPEYAAAAAAAAPVQVGAYVGTPIVLPDGQLFGTVCGFNPTPIAAEVTAQQPLLDVLSALLSAVLEADTAATEAARALERALSEADTDLLTGLMNRRGWERFLARDEDRYRRFGDPASVVMLDLDLLKRVNDTQGHAAGDRYIQAAADALRTVTRQVDALARLGGDEFAVVIAAGPTEAHQLVTRMEAALEAAGVLGSFGFAPYSVVAGFPGACEAADAAMYENKRARRAARQL